MTLVSEEENKRRFDDCVEFINSMEPPKFMEWWTVENTGFTKNGWFDMSHDPVNPTRFKTEEGAIQYIKGTKGKQGDARRWRYVHVTLERENNKTITTEIRTEI